MAPRTKTISSGGGRSGQRKIVKRNIASDIWDRAVALIKNIRSRDANYEDKDIKEVAKLKKEHINELTEIMKKLKIKYKSTPLDDPNNKWEKTDSPDNPDTYPFLINNKVQYWRHKGKPITETAQVSDKTLTQMITDLKEKTERETFGLPEDLQKEFTEGGLSAEAPKLATPVLRGELGNILARGLANPALQHIADIAKKGVEGAKTRFAIEKFAVPALSRAYGRDVRVGGGVPVDQAAAVENQLEIIISNIEGRVNEYNRTKAERDGIANKKSQAWKTANDRMITMESEIVPAIGSAKAEARAYARQLRLAKEYAKAKAMDNIVSDMDKEFAEFAAKGK